MGEDEILVSAGGGSVGQPIFCAAIEAARQMPNTRWRLLVGGTDAKARIAELSGAVMRASAEAPTIELPSAQGPETFNGEGLTDYLGTLSDDMTTYQEVLNRG